MPFIKATVAGHTTNSVAYHADHLERGDRNYVVSSTTLKDFFDCPERWKDGYEAPSTKAKEHGSALDCMLLTPHLFDQRYAVAPATYPAPAGHKKVKAGEINVGDPLKWNRRETSCKMWETAAEDEGKTVISNKDWMQCQDAVKRFIEDPILKPFLDCCDRQVHLTGLYKEETTGIVIPVQCLIDCAPRLDTEWSQCLGDIKTTRCAHPNAFLFFAEQMGYDIQAGFDIDFFNFATGEMRDTWLFGLQENYPPWQPGHEMLSQDLLAHGRLRYRTRLAKYAQCIQSGNWPGYDDHPDALQGFTVMVPTERMKEKALREWLAVVEGGEKTTPEVDDDSETVPETDTEAAEPVDFNP